MIKDVAANDEPGRQDRRRQWLALEPDLLNALEQLAQKEGCSLEHLIVRLISEALTHRLNRRF